MKKGSLILFTAALIWGFSLVALHQGNGEMGPTSFSAVRMTLGGISIFPAVLFFDSQRKKRGETIDKKTEYIQALKAAGLCGPSILATTLFQQYGLLYTSVGKCAFITAFYIFLVPVIGFFTGKKATPRIWFAVVMAVCGMYMITGSSGLDQLNTGDILSLGAAISYAIYIQLVGRVAEKVDNLKFSMVQFTLVGIVCWVIGIFVEPGQITLASCVASWWPIVFTGVFSCGIGYTLQILGQAVVEPNRATMILSSETVFSLFTGMIFLHEVLLVKEYIGCAIMTVAIIIAVLPEKKL